MESGLGFHLLEDPKVFISWLTPADRQLLNRPISKVLNSKRSAKTRFLRNIRRAHRRFLSERLERQHTIRHFFDPSVPNPAPIHGPALVKMDPARIEYNEVRRAVDFHQ